MWTTLFMVCWINVYAANRPGGGYECTQTMTNVGMAKDYALTLADKIPSPYRDQVQGVRVYSLNFTKTPPAIAEVKP